jgi:hypothetical protein
MVETPHTDRECLRLLDYIQAQGYLNHFDWGCKAGEHCGWAVIDTDSEDRARTVVPPMLRRKARIIELTKFSEEDVKSFH